MPNELWVYDVIGEGFFTEGVTGKTTKEQLADFDKKEPIEVHINSPGGDLFEAQAIAAQLSGWEAGVNVSIDGLAASAATIIALVGRNVTINEGGMYMIHSPWAYAVGNSSELRAKAEVLDKSGEQLAKQYERRTSLTLDEVKSAMDAETWYTSNEAVELGFANQIVEVKAAAWAVPSEFGYRHVPKEKQLKPITKAGKRERPHEAIKRQRTIDFQRASIASYRA